MNERSGSERWRVVLVEDDAAMRAFFASSIERSPELELRAELGCLSQARAWLGGVGHRADEPDVLLLDLGLPDGSGIALISEFGERFPHCECLVVSVFADEENVLASIEAGALGYIQKDAAPQDVAQTILQMKRGASPISPMIARRVLSKYREARTSHRASGPPAEPAAAAGEGGPLLSARQHEVLDLISRGFSYAEIASLTETTVNTVQTHVKTIYRKLAVHSRTEAVFEASRMGLLPRP